jgi:hypothetical protein
MISPVNHQQPLSGNKQSLYSLKNCLLIGDRRPRNLGKVLRKIVADARAKTPATYVNPQNNLCNYFLIKQIVQIVDSSNIWKTKYE